MISYLTLMLAKYLINKNWMKEVNESNGIYKYRWGDNEILSLYYDIHYETKILQTSQ